MITKIDQYLSTEYIRIRAIKELIFAPGKDLTGTEPDYPQALKCIPPLLHDVEQKKPHAKTNIIKLK